MKRNITAQEIISRFESSQEIMSYFESNNRIANIARLKLRCLDSVMQSGVYDNCCFDTAEVCKLLEWIKKI